MRSLGTLLSVLALCTLGCNDIPVDGLGATFTLKVSTEVEKRDSVKVDFLWVVDNSASMCQEQASLADSFDEFLKKIQQFVAIDYRIAVVTTDMISPDHKGRFRHHKTTEFPFACAQTEIMKCVRGVNGDEICEEQFGDDWICDAPEKAKNIVNCNGSLNSKCRKLCQEDWQCDLGFDGEAAGNACKQDSGSCRYKCLVPSGDPNNSGCVLRPATSTCPDTTSIYNALVTGADKDPADGRCSDGQGCRVGETGCANGSDCQRMHAPYLTPKTAEEFFTCVGVVGAEQHNNANLEQGLNAALFALATNRENAEQAREFLRDDAYLVVVFVSDEDDCSLDDNKDLKKELYGTCACEPDSSTGGPLRPVAKAVNAIKALKDDPGKVLVAAIVGDSQKEDFAGITEDREAYMKSKCGNCEDPTQEHPLLFNTYICNSVAGKADYGGRYVKFVQAFGKNGILTNLCSDQGVAPALETIADRIIRVFAKICLPRQIADKESLYVLKIGPEGTCPDGSECCVQESLGCTLKTDCGEGQLCSPGVTEVPAGEVEGTTTYRLEPSSDCDQTPDRMAISFNFLLAPGTGLQIDYQAVTHVEETPTGAVQ